MLHLVVAVRELVELFVWSNILVDKLFGVFDIGNCVHFTMHDQDRKPK